MLLPIARRTVLITYLIIIAFCQGRKAKKWRREKARLQHAVDEKDKLWFMKGNTGL
jgi:hypothetical protein